MRRDESTDPVPSADRLQLTGLWGGDLGTATHTPQRWLWHGYLAAGNLTLFTSQWKSGKTTLVAILLARRETGGTLAGRAVTAGKTVVVSEESPQLWGLRHHKLGFGNNLCLLCRPFPSKPTPEQWLALVARLAELHEEHGIDLVVIDPLASFMPGHDENNAKLMLEALMPLQQLTTRGVAILVLHHPRKDESLPGQASRGSGALPGHADIVIEMSWCAHPAADNRRRRLRGYSRYEETPKELVVELNPEGTDYAVVEAGPEEQERAGWRRLRRILEAASGKVTRKEILRLWLRDQAPPSEASLWRWLNEAATRGLVCRAGTGRKADPFVYWLPGKEGG